jgi:threonine/homoserine/homoserine lactone efflux protein
MPLQIYVAYVAACVVIVVVPGPTVTLIVANSLTHGTRAGLVNVAGTQAALAVLVGTVAVGMASIVATAGWWFDWIRLVGAIYLVWLGVKLIRSSSPPAEITAAPPPRGGFFWQGFIVLLGNPKALLLFTAFIPQFIDARQDYFGQVLFLGVTFMAVAAVFDSCYALLAGRARNLFSRNRIHLVTRASGLCLVSGGIWLALQRSR